MVKPSVATSRAAQRGIAERFEEPSGNGEVEQSPVQFCYGGRDKVFQSDGKVEHGRVLLSKAKAKREEYTKTRQWHSSVKQWQCKVM